MHIMVEFLWGVLYYWCLRLVPIIKRWLFDYMRYRKKNFGYASILVSFFFERVPALSTAVTLPAFPPREPRITWWGDIFLRKGGGGGI